MAWGLGRKQHASAQQDARGEPQPMPSERMASTESNVSEQDVYWEDPVAMWVEHHAAAAWQQPPPIAEEEGEDEAMDDQCSVPQQSAQLDEHPEPWLGHPAAEADPLRGHGRYSRVHDLSRGIHSYVQLALDRQTGQHVAIKLLRRDMLDVDAVTREVQNQRACASHPHIVQLLDVFVTAQHLAIVTSYANGGDLATLIARRIEHGKQGIGEDEARAYFQQLIMAIDYCHCLGIALRDIKVDNMLLHWGAGAAAPVVKLCDFGYSKAEAAGEACTSACGTPEYMAPEVLYGADYCGRAADVWAAGVSLYILLTAGFPFTRPKDEGEEPQRGLQAMFLRIVTGRYAPVPQLSKAAQHLLHVMLRPAPGDRITLDDILSHPWFLPIESRLRSVNADLICRPDGAATPRCRKSEAELAALVAEAASGCSGRRPDDLLWGRPRSG